MKINRVKATNKNKIGPIGPNFHYLLKLIGKMLKIMAGILISVVILMFIAEKVFTDEVHMIDDALSDKMFRSLVTNRQYHNAIYLMEMKPRLFNESLYSFQYKIELSDCYKHVGEYGKSEKLLLELYDEPLKNIPKKKMDQVDKSTLTLLVDMMHFNVAKELVDIYERIGDENRAKMYYRKMRESYNESAIPLMDSIVAERRGFISSMLGGEFSAREALEDISIRINYQDRPTESIKKMRDYLRKIIGSHSYNPVFKISCYNRLINWDFEQNNIFDAYVDLDQAVKFALSLNTSVYSSGFGELADYCYQVHDIDNCKRLMAFYNDYMENNYSKDDLEYLRNNIRNIKLLERDGKWDEIESQLERTCSGMKEKIEQNFLTMSEEQREYFAEKLQLPFQYAEYALNTHPSDRLAKLCFENSLFQRGLLLRSNMAVRKAVSRSSDKKLVQLYDSLMDYRRELNIRNSSQRLLNTPKRVELERKISEMDKRLSLASSEYRSNNTEFKYNLNAIQEKLEHDQSVVEFCDFKTGNGSNLYALVLGKSGGIKYLPLCSSKDIESIVEKSHLDLYISEKASNLLWKKVEPHLGNGAIFYTTTGTFNSIAIPSLMISQGHHLYEKRLLRLVSNPLDIISINSQAVLTAKSNASLWGGVKYSSKEEYDQITDRSVLTRGNDLKSLPGSLDEVNTVSEMLTNHNIKTLLYTGSNATESSFKRRSGKGDWLLHVSTHGFFIDDVEESNSNPMRSSGLLFAGANEYWTNDSLYQEQKYLKSGDDGILRSDEISIMDLSGCELVVLSACQTGLGYNHVSEGVYGLQRAFKLAGAKRILMSLWDVSDFHTSLLMQYMYKHLIEGDDFEIALSKSKNELRSQYNSPIYWGGFVLLN